MPEYVLIHDKAWSVVAEFAVNIEKHVDSRGRVSLSIVLKMLHAVLKHRQVAEHEVEVR